MNLLKILILSITFSLFLKVNYCLSMSERNRFSISDTSAISFPIHTISINPMEFSFFDFTINYEKTTDNKKYGVGLGYMATYNWPDNSYLMLLAYYPMTYHAIGAEFFGLNNNKLPYNAYEGPEIKLYNQFKIKNSFFIGPKLIVKYLYYKNHSFTDEVGDTGGYSVSYTRSERAFVTGLELFFTRDFYSKNLFWQFCFGFGARIKFRNTNTISHSGETYFLNQRPLGEEHSKLILPSLNIGLTLKRKIKLP